MHNNASTVSVPKARYPINPTLSISAVWGFCTHMCTSVLKARYNHTINRPTPRYIIMSYTTSYYHIVFRTYRSEQTIPKDHERELYAYLYGIARNLQCQTYSIGGMPDHVHLFVSLPATLPLSSFVQRMKTDSSKWMKANPNFPHFRGWGREYAGFSYSLRDKDMIVGYIMRQKEHHRKTTFAEEYRAFLEENGMVVDDRYFLNVE